MAVDREAIIRGPFYGYGTKVWSLLTPGNARWYDPTITAPDLNVERAKQLLDGLGLKDRNGDGVREDAAGHPVSFTLIYNADNKLRAAIATLLQADLARVGIRSCRPVWTSTRWSRKCGARNSTRRACSGRLRRCPRIPAWAANLFKSTGLTHYWDIAQPEGHPDTPAEARIDALFRRNVETLDLAKRKAAYRDMSQIINDECFLVWLPTPRLMVPVSSAFGNVRPSPMRPIILWNADRIFRRGGGKGL